MTENADSHQTAVATGFNRLKNEFRDWDDDFVEWFFSTHSGHEYQRVIVQHKSVQTCVRRYRNTKHGKAIQRRYSKSPNYREYQRTLRQSSAYKEYQLKYQQKYNETHKNTPRYKRHSQRGYRKKKAIQILKEWFK